MSVDTGYIGGKGQAGRWLEDTKDGRKRNLHIYMQDLPGTKEDVSYLGYFSDLNKEVVACNFAIALSDDQVLIQRLKPGTNDVQIKSIPVSRFMDFLDILIDDLT